MSERIEAMTIRAISSHFSERSVYSTKTDQDPEFPMTAISVSLFACPPTLSLTARYTHLRKEARCGI
jgi:hypothetical protein